MQNLSQNEFNQIAEMLSQPQDELKRIPKTRRIKNYEEMSKEELIISLLKSKQSIAELFNSNLDDDKISDIRRILNRLRDRLPRKYRREIEKTEKEENYEYLRKLVRNLSNKESK